MRNKSQHKNLDNLLLLFSTMTIIILANSCSCRFPDFPPGSTCTFKIPEPKRFECFTNQANTGRKIKLFVSVRITFLRSGSGTCTAQKTEFDTKGISVTPVDPPGSIFPIELPAMIPNDGTPFDVETNIVGEECSTCANGWGPAGEFPSGCPPLTITTTNPYSYRAAKPRWSTTGGYSSFNSVINIDPCPRIPNYPNTCVCTVN